MSMKAGDMTEIGRVGDLKDGEMKMVVVRGREILLAMAGGQYYAADNRCPHMGGNLSKGRLQGTFVTCPRHGSQYDLKDGLVIRWTNWPAALLALDQYRSQRRPLQVYPVAVDGYSIKAELPV